MSRKLGSGKLVIATHNAGKLKEIAALLAPHGVDCISAGLGWLGQSERPGGYAIDPMRRQQRGDFLEFAGVVRGDDQLSGTEAAGHFRTASSCAANTRSQPMRARRSRRSSPSSS